MSDHDPRETFKADQADAETSYQAREDKSWELNVRSSEAHAFQAEMGAMYALGKARVWMALARLITTVMVLGAAIAILTFLGQGPWA